MTTTTLKLIALALMFIDHIYEFIPGTPPIFTILGRISAPVFFFCTVWGFHYTRNRRVYLTRMYLCSALMGLLDFLLNTSLEQPVVPCYNNIFSTLVALSGIELIHSRTGGNYQILEIFYSGHHRVDLSFGSAVFGFCRG